MVKAKKEKVKKEKIAAPKNVCKEKISRRISYDFDETIEKDPTSRCEDAVLIPCSKFPYMTFPFENFNPMQTIVFPHIQLGKNLVVCSPTASGKTTVFEMKASESVAHGKKALYLAPQKALSEEKLQDWCSDQHFFGRYKIAIMTGDYAKTDAKIKELNESQIIVMTSEMLDSCTRGAKEEYEWLFNCGSLLIDEAHLIGEVERGDKLETAMMRFTALVPNADIILLSATVPNAADFQKWLTNLTGRPTELVVSNYRPCSLTKHFISHRSGNYTSENIARSHIIEALLQRHPDDIFLIFVGSISYGNALLERLKEKENCFFYHSKLPREKRLQLQADFNDRKIRVLIATTGLAWGVNMPARRVILAHVKFGIVENISTSTLIQEIGRSGRPKYDTEGDAYILIPERDFAEHYNRLHAGEIIRSKLIGDILAFHTIAEIKNKIINSEDDIVKWYARSLAAFQTRNLKSYEARAIIDRLIHNGMIEAIDSENPLDGPQFKATQTGIVTAQMYLKPEDVVAWKINFNKMFDKIKTDHFSDREIASALANVPSVRCPYVTKWEKEIIKNRLGMFVEDGVGKATACYVCALNADVPMYEMQTAIEEVRKDSERIVSAMSQIDFRTHRWNRKDFWKGLVVRLKYGVPVERVELCGVTGVGAVASKKLWDAGITSVKEMRANIDILESIIGKRNIGAIIAQLRGYVDKPATTAEIFYERLGW